jgi:hypothetical protein
VKKLFQLCIAFLFLSSSVCQAWNTLGHMVVANIAYTQLTPEVRAKVDKMVTDFNDEYSSIHSFLDIAPWPDTLHSQKIESFSHWHYIDIAFSADSTALQDLTDTDNIVWAINTIEPVLKNKNANKYESSRFLAFMVHFVADIHQPLHTVSRITSNYPNGDQGGNLYKILDPMKTTSTISLHKFWDEGADLFNDDTSADHITFLTQTIMHDYPENTFGNAVNDLNPETWANEGLESAKIFVYTTPENQIPSTNYQNSAKQIVEAKVALAGYRLANLLNLLLA